EFAAFAHKMLFGNSFQQNDKRLVLNELNRLVITICMMIFLNCCEKIKSQQFFLFKGKSLFHTVRPCCVFLYTKNSKKISPFT
ncbi:MAG: hypothetical protein ACI4JN_04505, partial [Ruminococcus sp.]